MILKFEWDEEKDWSNKLKHGIRFEEAQQIWADESALEFYDPDHSDDEERWIRVGVNVVRGILFVVFSEPGVRTIRIISARKANKEERQVYERSLRLR